MYRPSHFAWDDRASQSAFCQAHPFASVVATGATGLEAQHLPLLVDHCADRLVLYGHAAVGNPLWQAEQALAIFSGPHAYISAAWYGEADTVPTWNYLAVHVSGPLRLITSVDEVRACFARLAAADPERAQWEDRLGEAAYQRLAEGIRWFRIDGERVEGKAKLSQHHSPERRGRVIARLSTSPDQAARTLGEAMARTLTGDSPWPTGPSP